MLKHWLNQTKSSLVIDTMIGQEAANVAREFNAQLERVTESSPCQRSVRIPLVVQLICSSHHWKTYQVHWYPKGEKDNRHRNLPTPDRMSKPYPWYGDILTDWKLLRGHDESKKLLKWLKNTRKHLWSVISLISGSGANMGPMEDLLKMFQVWLANHALQIWRWIRRQIARKRAVWLLWHRRTRKPWSVKSKSSPSYLCQSINLSGLTRPNSSCRCHVWGYEQDDEADGNQLK